MAELTDEEMLAKLKRIRNSGVLSLRVGDESVQYRTLAELDAAIATLESAVNGTRTVRNLYQKSKGLC